MKNLKVITLFAISFIAVGHALAMVGKNNARQELLAWIVPAQVTDEISLSLTYPNDRFLDRSILDVQQDVLALGMEADMDGEFLVVQYGAPDDLQEIARLQTSSLHYSSLDNFMLLPGPCRADGLPDIVLVQTSLPVEGDDIFRPGPPTAYRFAYDGETYRYADAGCDGDETP